MFIFKYEDYKDWLVDQIEANRSTKGYQSRLAEAAGCQRSYLSQVLNGHQQLTMEHGHGLCLFWNFNELQTDYFIQLLLFAKAGNEKLRNHFQRKIRKLRKVADDIESKIKGKPIHASEKDLAKYYSTWYWSAIHIALSVPGLDTPQAISRALQLPEFLVRNVISELSNMNLVRSAGGERWQKLEGSVHLKKDSPFIYQHHRNWRHLPSTFLEAERPNALDRRFSAVFSVSRADLNELRQRVADFIEECSVFVSASDPEEVASLSIDLIHLTSGNDIA